MGTVAFLLEATPGQGLRAGLAGPAPTQYEPGRPAASELRPGWSLTGVSSSRRRAWGPRSLANTSTPAYCHERDCPLNGSYSAGGDVSILFTAA